MRSQSPDESAEEEQPARMVGDMAVPTLASLTAQRVEAVGLVGGLKGTGSDPGPSPYRAALLEEMQIRGVRNPNAVLASRNFALVVMQGWLRPGIQKGDHFDIEVRVPSQTDTTSLRGGSLWESRLMEMSMMDDRQVHHGNVLALAQGPVLIDPSVDPKQDRVALGRGRVLGGGVALKPRPLGLVLTPKYQSVCYSAQGGSCRAAKRPGVRRPEVERTAAGRFRLAANATHRDASRRTARSGNLRRRRDRAGGNRLGWDRCLAGRAGRQAG
jgi:hypothetical protein